MVKREDIRVEGSTYHLSLLKLVGKEVSDIRGHISGEFGGPTFVLTEILFTDGTSMGVEGEHDHPYVTEYRATNPQPNFDDETLQALLDEEQD